MRELPAWQVVGASLLLAAVTAAAVVWRRKFPQLLVGWLWYLGMMVPVIGLVQIGAGNGADRFTYLPQIGLAIALVWTAADVCAPEKGTGDLSPERPSGCCAQKVPVPFSRRGCHVPVDDPARLRLAADDRLARQRDALEPHV